MLVLDKYGNRTGWSYETTTKTAYQTERRRAQNLDSVKPGDLALVAALSGGE